MTCFKGKLEEGSREKDGRELEKAEIEALDFFRDGRNPPELDEGDRPMENEDLPPDKGMLRIQIRFIILTVTVHLQSQARITNT